MAGSLPGVEAARRRRFHQSSESSTITSSSSGSTRRSSFCLYANGHDYHLSTTSSMLMETIFGHSPYMVQLRNPANQILCDESRLSTAAREAKKRLDERLQPQWRLDTKRTTNTQQSSRSLDDRPMIQSDLQTEEPKLRKSGSKRLGWLKNSWKWSEQEECAVCLEQFKATRRDTVMQLPCAHKFHANCLVPWLEGNAHCPCCRMEIPSS